MARILIVDDEKPICQTLNLHLGRKWHEVGFCHTAEDGLAIAITLKPEIIILDIRMPGMGGLVALPLFRELLPEVSVIMITAFHDMETTIRSTQGGAVEYIHKPINIEELDQAITAAINRQQGWGQSNGLQINLSVESSPSTGDAIIANSLIMRDVFKTIGAVSGTAPKVCTVMIQGASGTGKELVARVIHRSSSNAKLPFIAINCAALVENLLESEMFGHEQGAFTGATLRKEGKFFLVGEGTLFLDEVAELTPAIQAKLLRVLQERVFERVGGHNSLTANCRIVAATNKDLRVEVAEGRFREDLFYRLTTFTIELPPLTERTGDIPLLIQHLVKKINRETGRRVTQVSESALEALIKAPWPGNVRQLENTLMKSVVMSHGNILSLPDLPPELQQYSTTEDISGSSGGDERLEDVEKRHIIRTLRQTGWHKGKACELLGISRPRLDRKITLYELEK